MTPATRLRALLLLLGATAILGVLSWDVADDDLGPPAGRRAASAAAAVAEPRVPILSDSELARRAAGYGVLVMLREHDDTGSFYFVDPADSTRLLRELGFFPASALLDGSARFEAAGDSAEPVRLAVPVPQVVDSALRDPGDGCILEVPVPTRRVAGPPGQWTIALAPGAASAVPASLWRAPVDSVADRALALQLAAGLPPDSAAPAPPPAADSILRGVPFRVVAVHRFTLDGAELLVADVRREGAALAGTPDAGTLAEQRVLVAERDAGEPASAFRIAWHAHHLGDPDETTTLEPVQLLRLGPRRLLTLYLSADYEDGGGGVFVARLTPGRWTEVAEWYGGC